MTIEKSHINMTALKECIPELLALNHEKADAALKYSAGIDAVSARTFTDKAVLRKVITALAKDKANDTKDEADELSELLDELQEFAGE